MRINLSLPRPGTRGQILYSQSGVSGHAGSTAEILRQEGPLILKISNSAGQVHSIEIHPEMVELTLELIWTVGDAEDMKIAMDLQVPAEHAKREHPQMIEATWTAPAASPLMRLAQSITSLDKTLKACGRAPMTPKELSTMTLMELLMQASHNGLRFCTEGELHGK